MTHKGILTSQLLEWMIHENWLYVSDLFLLSWIIHILLRYIYESTHNRIQSAAVYKKTNPELINERIQMHIQICQDSAQHMNRSRVRVDSGTIQIRQIYNELKYIFRVES